MIARFYLHQSVLQLSGGLNHHRLLHFKLLGLRVSHTSLLLRYIGAVFGFYKLGLQLSCPIFECLHHHLFLIHPLGGLSDSGLLTICSSPFFLNYLG